MQVYKISIEPHEKSEQCRDVWLQKVSDLPLEMLETVLMRSFLMLYVNDFEVDDDGVEYVYGRSRRSEHRSFVRIASVCANWRQTLIGWPESPTSRWCRHQLKKLIEGMIESINLPQ